MADLAELLVRIDATTETMRRELKRGDQAVADSARNVEAGSARVSRALQQSNTALANNSRSMGTAFQQAGFQIGDFAVQVASGQGVLRPLIQQGTQLVSAFGPWGAVLGAAGAVAGALATTLLNLGSSTDDAAKAQENFLAAMEETNKVLETAAERTKRLQEEQQQLAIASNTAVAAQQTARAILLERQLADAQQASDTLQAGGPTLTPELTPVLALRAAEINRLTVELNSAQAAADAALEAVDKLLAGPTGAAQDESAKSAQKSAKEETEAFHRFADGLVERGKQQREAAEEATKRFAEQDAAVRKAQAETRKETERAQAAAQDLGFSFESAFENAILSGNDFRSVLKGIEQDIAKIILRRFVTKPLGDAASDFLSNALGSLFSGGGATGSVSSGTASATAVDFLAGARASGGPVSAGRPFLVGERGPELFIPNTAGAVVANDRLGGGGGPVFNIDARGASVDAVVRLEKMVRTLNGSIEGRAVAAVSDFSRRGR